MRTFNGPTGRETSVARVGFDPTRKHRRTNFDYMFVGFAILVCAALVLWAFLG